MTSNTFNLPADTHGHPYVDVVLPEDMTEDMTPPPGPSRDVLKASIAAYVTFLRTKYGRSDYTRFYLESEAKELNRRREALRIRSQEIGRFYNNALLNTNI